MAIFTSRRKAARTNRFAENAHSPARLARSALRIEQLEDRCVPAVDVILEWNAVMIQADAVSHSGGVNDQPGPVLAQRAFAITSAAMYDAYNSIERIGQRYLVTAPNAFNADSDAAVAQAAHDTLVALYPSQRAAFDAALTQTLRRIPDGSRENRGRAVGAFVADAILDARANDGGNTFADIQNPPYVPNGQPGFHDVDPLHPGQGFYGPDAGNVDTFAIRRLRAVRPRPPRRPGRRLGPHQHRRLPAHAGLRGGLRRGQAPRRRRRHHADPADRRADEIGIYWGYDGRPGLGTPPRLYNQIARTVADQQDNTEAENARLFALVNLAMADAGMTAWEAKYDEDFWRPILGIRRGGDDGNPDTRGDANWTPLGAPASNPLPRRIPTSRRRSRPTPRGTPPSARPCSRPWSGSTARDNITLHVRLRRVQRHHPGRRRHRPAAHRGADVHQLQSGVGGERPEPHLPRHPLGLRQDRGHPHRQPGRQLRLQQLPPPARRRQPPFRGGAEPKPAGGGRRPRIALLPDRARARDGKVHGDRISDRVRTYRGDAHRHRNPNGAARDARRAAPATNADDLILEPLDLHFGGPELTDPLALDRFSKVATA